MPAVSVGFVRPHTGVGTGRESVRQLKQITASGRLDQALTPALSHLMGEGVKALTPTLSQRMGEGVTAG
jgi:hypothetical protein